jgi:hypothetical protein
MLIQEVAGAEAQVPRLVALAGFLGDRARDEGVEPRISRASFLQLAANMGISLTPGQLKDMIQRPPLNNLIVDVTGDDSDPNGEGEVVFKGSETVGADGTVMTPDMARLTVDNMAKRAVDIK